MLCGCLRLCLAALQPRQRGISKQMEHPLGWDSKWSQLFMLSCLVAVVSGLGREDPARMHQVLELVGNDSGRKRVLCRQPMDIV